MIKKTDTSTPETDGKANRMKSHYTGCMSDEDCRCQETDNEPDRYQEWADSELVLDHEADPSAFETITNANVLAPAGEKTPTTKTDV